MIEQAVVAHIMMHPAASSTKETGDATGINHLSISFVVVGISAFLHDVPRTPLPVRVAKVNRVFGFIFMVPCIWPPSNFRKQRIRVFV